MSHVRFWEKFTGTLVDRPWYPPHHVRVGPDPRKGPPPVARPLVPPLLPNTGTIAARRGDREWVPPGATTSTANAGVIAVTGSGAGLPPRPTPTPIANAGTIVCVGAPYEPPVAKLDRSNAGTITVKPNSMAQYRPPSSEPANR